MRQAGFTLKARCVIEAVETYTSGGITYWSQCWIHIPITLTCNALTNLHTISVELSKSYPVQHKIDNVNTVMISKVFFIPVENMYVVES